MSPKRTAVVLGGCPVSVSLTGVDERHVNRRKYFAPDVAANALALFAGERETRSRQPAGVWRYAV